MALEGYFANDSTYVCTYVGGYNDGSGHYFEEKTDEKYVITNRDLIYHYKTRDVKLVEDADKE